MEVERGGRCIFNSPSTSTLRELWQGVERGKCKCDGLKLEFRTQTWARHVAPSHCTTPGQARPEQVRPGLSQFIFQCPLPTWFVLLRASAHGANCMPNEFIDSCFSFHSGQIAFRYDSHAPLLRPFQVGNSPGARCATTRVHCQHASMTA